MTLQLWGIDHAPRSLPIWHVILDDLGNPPPQRVARVLGVSLRTAYRWLETGDAPRSAQMALFWLTRWGRSAVHCQATNDAIVACQYVDGLRREVQRLEGNVRHLTGLASGAANAPLLR
jgi:predicted DNA-binding transcriptional regulator AlpA